MSKCNQYFEIIFRFRIQIVNRQNLIQFIKHFHIWIPLVLWIQDYKLIILTFSKEEVISIYLLIRLILIRMGLIGWIMTFVNHITRMVLTMIIIHDILIFKTIDDIMSNNTTQEVDSERYIRTNHQYYPLKYWLIAFLIHIL